MISTDQFRFDIMSENQLKGPDAKYIKIISSDNHEFIIKKDVALTSGTLMISRYMCKARLGTIKAMLSGPGVFQEQETNEIHFQEIPSHVLSKGNTLIKNLLLRVQYADTLNIKPVIPTAPWKYPNSQLPQKSPLNYSWLLTFSIVEKFTPSSVTVGPANKVSTHFYNALFHSCKLTLSSL